MTAMHTTRCIGIRHATPQDHGEESTPLPSSHHSEPIQRKSQSKKQKESSPSPAMQSCMYGWSDNKYRLSVICRHFYERKGDAAQTYKQIQPQSSEGNSLLRSFQGLCLHLLICVPFWGGSCQKDIHPCPHWRNVGICNILRRGLSSQLILCQRIFTILRYFTVNFLKISHCQILRQFFSLNWVQFTVVYLLVSRLMCKPVCTQVLRQ